MISVKKTSGGMTHTSAFIGPVDHPLSVKVDISTLTTKEVDVNGFLKPNVPLTRAGALVAAQGISSPAAAVARTGNTGNGTVGSLVGKAGKPDEVITLKATSSTNFNVYGSRSGHLGNATVGTPFVSSAINLTITAGGNAFAAGDEFSIVVTAATPDYVFGSTIEATRIVDANPTDASLLANTGTIPVTVGVIGVVNRDIMEDTLGRALTADEVAAFDAPGCKLVLSRT